MTEPLHRFKAEFFKALAHPARIHILELLRGTERTVSELQGHLDVDPSSVSQQLGVLRAKNIVQTRKAGTSVYYSVRDPQLYILLDAAREIFNNHLADLQAMLEQERVEDEAFPPALATAAESAPLASTARHAPRRHSAPSRAPRADDAGALEQLGLGPVQRRR